MPDRDAARDQERLARPGVAYCKGGATTCEFCVGSCGIEEFEERNPTPYQQAVLNHTRTAAQDHDGRAYISEDGLYRYSLTREIVNPEIGCLDEDERNDTLTFIGLNPSTADAMQDDPTIRRCIRFAREWGFARLHMVNLYGYRATNPDDLFAAEKQGIDIVGPENSYALATAFMESDRIVAAWGALAPWGRVAQFTAAFDGWQVWALGLSKDGCPRHPLYMRADAQPFVYDIGGRRAA